MHNGTAVWDGTYVEAALGPVTVKWEVDFASSPTVKKSAEFGIAKDHNAVDAARALWTAWNAAHQKSYPATLDGVAVVFGSTIEGNEIVGMRFTVKGKGPERLSATGAEREVVKDLWVYRERIPHLPFEVEV